MSTTLGIACAFAALASWGVGDFLIQRAVRRHGAWEALFAITAFAAVVLAPFVWHDLMTALTRPGELAVLAVASVVIFGAAVLDFRALGEGKIAVVEPVLAGELAVVALLSAWFLGEALTFGAYALMAVLMVGIALVSTKSLGALRAFRAERGVWLAVGATVAMGGANVLFGVSARETGPLLVNWFTSAVMAAGTLAVLLYQGRVGAMLHAVRRDIKPVLAVAFVDNLAWVAYSASMTAIPVAIATGISEGYIALAAALGIAMNRERLKRHQWVGMALTIGAAIALGFVAEA